MLGINIKYFGMISEAVSKNNEIIRMSESVTVEEFKKLILQKYPKLKKLNFQIALNLTISDNEEKIKDQDEIALLPPFAGG